MPVSPRIGAGLALAGVLIGLAALQAYSRKLDAIKQVHAKYDEFEAAALASFEKRATDLKGFPPLNVQRLFVITEDDQLRDGQMVLFIGLKDGCVKTVFGLSAKVYREILSAPAGA